MAPQSKVFTERHRLYLFAALVAIMGMVLAQLTPYLFGVRKLENRTPIKVGVLHSMSGTMAVSEKAVAFATLFAVDQLNENGDVLGRKVEPILIDGWSDWDVFAEEVEKLIDDQKVSALRGEVIGEA
ncbi:transporter substrate-binding protein [Magnetovibrio sp. PR-2]|uniref:transporter substrate-binding protein n=1 Tax=Magnetovibrio sp. PR-2 TaxID=3120356 RepID=UPI002FCE6820